MIGAGPRVGGGSCSQAQDHAPATKSRRVLKQFLGGEDGRMGAKKLVRGPLLCEDVWYTWKSRQPPEIGRGPPVAIGGGGWATKQARMLLMAFHWASLDHGNRKKGGGYCGLPASGVG